MHNAYYQAGILEAITVRADQDQLPLTEAAYQVQVSDFGVELNKDLYIYPSLNEMSFYEKGLALLQTIEPELKFYLEEVS